MKNSKIIFRALNEQTFLGIQHALDSRGILATPSTDFTFYISLGEGADLETLREFLVDLLDDFSYVDLTDIQEELGKIESGINQAEEDLIKLNKRFDLRQATVFTIDCQQELIVLQQIIRQMESDKDALGTIREKDGEKNSLAHFAQYYTKQYFNRMSQHSQKTNQAISQRYEEEINVETFRRLHNFYYGYLPTETKAAIKLLGLNKW